MRTRVITILILVALLINYGFVHGQEQGFSKRSIKTGLGIGASMSNNTDGAGFVYTVGYQREIWKDRLRINPNFTIGHYSTKFI